MNCHEMLYRLYGPQRMNPIDIGDPIPFHLAPPDIRVFTDPVKYVNIY